MRYRRLWEDARFSKRLRKASDAAERLFWRLCACQDLTDDCGNFPWDAEEIRVAAIPHVSGWTERKIAAVLKELASLEIISSYTAEGRQYAHLYHFEEKNPMGRGRHRLAIHPPPTLPSTSEHLKAPSSTLNAEKTPASLCTAVHPNSLTAMTIQDKTDGNDAPSSTRRHPSAPVSAKGVKECKKVLDADADADTDTDTNTGHPGEQEFEERWTRYPSKVKKKKAFGHFRASVKNLDDLKKLDQALENYLRSDRVRRGIIQDGSTWFNNWQDWVEPTEYMMTGRKAPDPPKPEDREELERYIEQEMKDGDDRRIHPGA